MWNVLQKKDTSEMGSVLAIFMAISATRPRADVAYCIHALARRLARTHNCCSENSYCYSPCFEGSGPNLGSVLMLFLEERLECFRVLKYDVEIDPPRTNDLDTPDLLEHLPALQLFSALPTRIGSFQSTLSTSDFSSIWFISLTSSFANNIDILMKQLEQFKAQEKLMKKKRKGNIESHEDAPNWTY
ncbi:unnamed protein product [Microthlaspi erraticum]|uniref:Uncharacterized protein n=1 Tax=Microthlaspi erraticum TaxID=1685480 RepID=A0A6D2KFZ8_9BRAS|nr:unnamed protein product [Microthlaspi erraticum]